MHGDVLFNVGDTVDNIYILLRGNVETFSPIKGKQPLRFPNIFTYNHFL